MEEWEIEDMTLRGWTMYLSYNPHKVETNSVDTYIDLISPKKMNMMFRTNVPHFRKGFVCCFNPKGKPFSKSVLANCKVYDFMLYLSIFVPNAYSDTPWIKGSKFKYQIGFEEQSTLPIYLKKVEDGIDGLSGLLRKLVLEGINGLYVVEGHPNFIEE